MQDIWLKVSEMLSGVERDFEIVITERAGQAMEMTRDLDISRWVLTSDQIKNHGLADTSSLNPYVKTQLKAPKAPYSKAFLAFLCVFTA